MPKRSITETDVLGKRALVRVDFNVPLRDGEVADDTRIRASLPTIQLLLDRGAAVVLATHLGRPKGKADPAYSVAPVARSLSELLGQGIAAISAVAGPEAERAATALRPGDVLLLENTRFEPGEEANDPQLAASLARLGDLFVNDAFGTAHRAHASTVGVANLLSSYAGLLLHKEETALSRLLLDPERPFMAVLGGAKVSTRCCWAAAWPTRCFSHRGIKSVPRSPSQTGLKRPAGLWIVPKSEACTWTSPLTS
jgi:phosphoglycerate kinase